MSNAAQEKSSHPMVADAQKAIAEPEVQDILKRLSAYGLGVFMPHMHTADEEFAPLPLDLVQVEENMQVSFVPRSMASGDAVGWRWDDKLQTVMACQTCVQNRFHHYHPKR